MNPWLAYLAVMLAFVVGYMIGHRFGSRPNEEQYNCGWLDGYYIGRGIARPDTKQPVPPMVTTTNTTTSGALTPVTMIHTPKRPPAKIRAKRKVKP
jgi:hypothetical protein